MPLVEDALASGGPASIGCEMSAILAAAAPAMVHGSFRLDAPRIAHAPAAVIEALSAFDGWSVLVYGLPIVDEAMWLWCKVGDERYLFANHLLERAAGAVERHLAARGVATFDIARELPGRVSLVELGVLAGLGTRGLNNLLLHPEHGSWIQLHALAVDCLLPVSAPLEAEVCVKCGNCMRGCPAGALKGRSFAPERCSRLVASPSMARSKAVAISSSSYIECAECIRTCPVGAPPEVLLAWKR